MAPPERKQFGGDACSTSISNLVHVVGEKGFKAVLIATEGLHFLGENGFEVVFGMIFLYTSLAKTG